MPKSTPAEEPDRLTQFNDRLTQFNEWVEALPEMDQINFETLVNLPTAETVIASMKTDTPEKQEYRDNLVFALALKRVLAQMEEENNNP